MDDLPIIAAGTKIHGPGGQFYEIRCEIRAGMKVMASQFLAGGGAPPAIAGERLPDWLVSGIGRLRRPDDA